MECPVLGSMKLAFHAVGTGLVRPMYTLRSSVLLPGKVPSDVLEKLVFTRLGKKDPSVLLGPGVGQDASLLQVGDRVLVASTDPITGSIEDVGWLAVHVNANDIAAFGVPPKWFLASIMLPGGSSVEEVRRIMSQIDGASKELGIAVAGGHTEVTESIDHPIVAGFMLGVTSPGEYVTSSGARPGDSIVITKTIAMEGTAILAAECHDFLTSSLDERVLEDARRLREQISVVREGVTAFKTGHLTSMHDPTEGGLSGGIHEISDASNVGFCISMDAMPIDESTRQICEALGINPLELISSGCMLMTCQANYTDDVVKSITTEGVQAAVIGEVVEDKNHRVISDGGNEVQLPRPRTDALWDALKRTTVP